MYRIRVLSVALFSCLLGSCGDADPVALVEVEPPANREIHMQPSFQLHIQEIFVRNNCTDCHGIGNGHLLLGPDAEANHMMLVNVPAYSEPKFLLVEPYDTVNSYLLMRLENRQNVGPWMPIGVPLDGIDLGNIKNWVMNGAPNN